MTVFAIVGLLPAMSGTKAAVSAARARRDGLAVQLAARGTADLAAGQPLAAADQFRAAMDHARDRNIYRRQLAEALVAAGRSSEARAQLQTLWTVAPGDGAVNLELGRLAARDGNVADALRYYHAAIDGAWTDHAATARRDAQIELAGWLAGRGDWTRASAEIAALAGDQPDDPRVARLAGMAAFHDNDFRTARERLTRAAQAGAELDADSARMLDLSTRVIALDPHARGLGSRERVRRTVKAFELASDAVERCPGASPDTRASLDAVRATVSERTLVHDADALDVTIEAVAAAERDLAARCPATGGDELAMQLVFRQRPPGA